MAARDGGLSWWPTMATLLVALAIPASEAFYGPQCRLRSESGCSGSQRYFDPTASAVTFKTRARDASDELAPGCRPPALRPRTRRRDPPLGTVTTLDLGFVWDNYNYYSQILNTLPSGGVIFFSEQIESPKLYRLDPDGSLAVLFDESETNTIEDAVVDPKGRGYFVAHEGEIILVGHDGEVLRRVKGRVNALAATSDSLYFLQSTCIFQMDIDAMVSDGNPLDRTRPFCKDVVFGSCRWMCFDANESSLIVATYNKSQILRVSMSTQEVSLIVQCREFCDLAVASDGIIYVICSWLVGPKQFAEDLDDLCVHQVVKTDHEYAIMRMDVNLERCECLALDEHRGLLYVLNHQGVHTIAVPTYAERRERLIWPVFRLFALASLGHARLAAPLPPLYRTEAVYRRLVRLPRCLVHRVLCYAVSNVSF